MRIFIVEDSLTLRKSIRLLIGDLQGVVVVGEAWGSTDAIDAIRRTLPDVVLLDLHLAEGHGLDVLEQLRIDRLSCRVIVMTSFAYELYRERCLDAGADDFFDKSEFDDVVRLIELWVRAETKDGVVQPMSDE